MRDRDGDGFGDINAPPGGVAGSDCDDSSESTFVGSAELEAPGTCARDLDGDGFGASTVVAGVTAGVDCDDTDARTAPGIAFREADPTACAQDTDFDGYANLAPRPGVTAGTDCDDASSVTFPGAAPNEVDPALCFRDADGDDFGDLFASAPVSTGTDCNDDDRDTFVNSAENELTGLCTRDRDGDGFGDAEPPAFAVAGTDCDDLVATTFLGATEIPSDGVDQDCNDVDLCYEDTDGDGFGSSTLVDDDDLVCGNGTNGVAAFPGDCNTASANTFPGAGFLDDPSACNTDADGDGYAALVPEAGGVAGTDCDDTNIETFPNKSETPGNGVDDNCDMQELCFEDLDGDGFGSRSTVLSADEDCDDVGESRRDSDCDDTPVDGAGCTESCGVYFTGSGIDAYEVSCVQPVGSELTANTGLSWTILEARALRYDTDFNSTTDTDADYIALQVDAASQTSVTQDWCAEYQSLCEQLGGRATGCGANQGGVGALACEENYNSYRPGDGHLRCSPASRMQRLAQASGFTDPTPAPANTNSFGFFSCDQSRCSSTLCSGSGCNLSLGSVSFDNLPAYTACRFPNPQTPTPPRSLTFAPRDESDLRFPRLTWTAPVRFGSDRIESYRVLRGTLPGSLSVIDEVEAPFSNFTSMEFEYIDEGVATNVLYFYAIVAVNDEGFVSEASNQVSARPVISVPGEVPFVGVAAPFGLQLSWQEPASDGGSPILAYRVYRGDTIAAVDTLLAELPASASSFLDFARRNVLDDAYRVVAVNAFGEGLSRPGIPTGTSFLLREIASTTFPGFGSVPVDYDVYRLALGAFVPQTENWCSEYQDFCALFGKFGTGCPQTNPSASIQACSTEYDAVLPVDNNLGCFPNIGVSIAASNAGFPDATSRNSFAFGQCSISDCERTIDSQFFFALPLLDAVQPEVYTVCRDP
ncbi:MAG: MopE-related protein [Myxococcota bacterium]